MPKKTIADIDVAGKRVLVRVDFNVPLSSKNPEDEIYVTDDTRIQAALPKKNHLLKHGAPMILCHHVCHPTTA
ncbi:MAG: phosphoglycerate kinase, partial [Anaerolineales bacterium]|nr:phosphoglycerate kinase [Anaerolineales bacterium]